jgi:hypothetical protein
MIVAGDGNAYVPYVYSTQTVSEVNVYPFTDHIVSTLMVLRVSPDGSWKKLQIKQLEFDQVIDRGGHDETSGSYFGLTQHDTTYGWAGFPSVITNGAAGAAVLVPGPVCPNNDCGAQQALMTFIANDGIASQANLPIPNFLPVLQREDGSYIGNDANNNLDAIGPDGTLLWQIPQATLGGVTPLYATADGGAIVTSTVPGCAGGDIAETLVAQFLCQLTGESLPNPYSPQGQLGTLYTLDQDGNVVVTRDQNGNIIPPPPDTGARVSWTGNWYADPPGTITSNSLPPLDFALSRGSFAWGNPSATSPATPGAAARPWKFILAWQNDFDFIPFLPSKRTDLTTGITSESTTIKASALEGLKNAYKDWSATVLVEEGAPRTGDHRAVVHTSFSVCNGTVGVVESDIDYECNVEQAQNALQVMIHNAAEEASALANPDLIRAIGRGIGNNSAHEIAHQFLVLCCGMDALTSVDPNSAATYNNGDVEGDPSPAVVDSDPAPYTGYGKDKKTPIHWEDNTKKALNACLSTNYVNYGASSCIARIGIP